MPQRTTRTFQTDTLNRMVAKMRLTQLVAVCGAETKFMLN